MSGKYPPKNRQDEHGGGARPWLLAAGALTPATRTPWGGRYLVEELRPDGEAREGPAGESWDFSVEPDFPARLVDGTSLAARIDSDPASALGAAYPSRSNTALLVKLLDAASPLSVQIHPSDGYAGLAADEGGKPEAWYVVAHRPGAGLYVGLRELATRELVETTLEEGGDLSALLHFVEVRVGDFFVIDAGTAHAVGAGCTLVEPQRVLPGRKGVTYRYWDWNRRYDEAGRLCHEGHGKPRALHIRDALAVTDWDAPREAALLKRIRVRAGAPDVAGPAKLTPLGGDGGAPSDALRVARISGTGEVRLPDWRRMRALTVLEGEVRFEDGSRLKRGECAALPASFHPEALSLHAVHAILSAAL